MSREYRLYLSDIVEAQTRIQEYTKEMTYEEFAQSKITIDAVIRNLEVIGEAAGKLPPEIRKKSPDIEWRKITAMRNVLTHEYFGVNTQIVWDVVRNKIKQVGRLCQKLLEAG
jgi:uncharacterized protein with HEPN domain